MNIIIDLVLIGILAFCIWNGYRKGLILGIGGILALIIAFYGANLIAETYSSEFTSMLEPFISELVDKAVDTSAQKYADDTDTIDENRVYDISYDSLENLGFLKSAATNISKEVSEEISEVGHDLKNALIDKLSSTIAYVASLIIVFLLILIIITVISNIINLAFKLPGLDFINDLGGAILGFIKGLIFLFAISWALRFFGFVIPASVVDKTLILGWLMESNPIITLFGI